MASAIQSAVSSIQSALGTPTQKVLLLGSGFVAKPCLDYLAQEGIAITVGMQAAPWVIWELICVLIFHDSLPHS
jgi:hypothetical protein